MAEHDGGNRRYLFDSFCLDVDQQILTYDGRPVSLRPTLFAVLQYLVQNPLRVVGKDELLEAVWAGRTVEEANLSQAVFWLRSALQQHGGEGANKLIATERGKGYRLTIEPRREAEDAGATRQEATADRAEADRALHAAGARRRPVALGAWRRPRWPAGAAVALAAAAGLALGGYALWGRMQPLHAGNTVVLSDFANDTREPIFDRSLATVLRIDLGQSPFVSVMPEKRARETLSLMKKPQDAALTPTLAQEVCVRTGADAVLDGGVTAFGSRYVLTLIATDCSGQRTLAAEKADVANRESVVPALDRLIAAVRGKLGEPVASVDRFNVPLAAETTGSLDALKAYSEGVWMVNHGRRAEAIQLEQRALELDPEFGMAYAVLGTTYWNLFDYKNAQVNLTRAYELRRNMNERSQSRIAVIYDNAVTKDFEAEKKHLTQGLAMYPQDDVNWANFANLEAFTGQFEASIRDARRSLAINPRLELPYGILARAELGAGHFREALDVCRSATQHEVAGEAIHREMMRIAWATGDLAAFAREVDWADHNQPAFSMMYVEGEAAWSNGKVKAGSSIFDAAEKVSKAQGIDAIGIPYQARLLVDLGLTENARARLSHANDPLDSDYIFTVAEIGDPAKARESLSKVMGQYPSDTLLNNVYAPEIRAALALRSGHPAEAVADLQAALTFRARSPEVDHQLGVAYLAAGDGVRAAASFNMILAHKGWYPESPLNVLAELGLARALVLQHDLPGARRAYQTFLTRWGGADADVPVLRAARAEYARLT